MRFIKARRRWDHYHSEGFDSDYEDFTPTYGFTRLIEDFLLIEAINGFSCGFPECCVFDFLRKTWLYFRTHNPEDFRSKRVGFTETGQPYAQCDGHKALNTESMPSTITGEI